MTPKETLNSAPPWRDQDAELERLWRLKTPAKDIAAALGRTEAAITVRASKLGLPRNHPPGRKPNRAPESTSATTDSPIATPAPVNGYAGETTCLRCGITFLSWDRRKNRICTRHDHRISGRNDHRINDQDEAEIHISTRMRHSILDNDERSNS
jgi:hypothetical protein